MTILFACTETHGFTHSAGAVEYTGGATYYNTSRSRGCLQNGYTETTAPLSTPLDEGYVSFMARNNGWENGAELTMYDASGVGVLRLYRESSSSTRIEYWDGAAWATALTAPFASIVTQGVIKFKTGVGGEVSYFFNNSLIATASIGDATNAFSYLTVSVIGGSGLSSHRKAFSEIMIADDVRSLLYCICETEAPTGAGTDADGTGTYLDVDDPTNDNGATNIVLAAAGNRNSFTSPARTAAPSGSEFLGVSVAADMKRDVSGPQNARFYLKISGTRYYSDTFALTEGLVGYHYIWPLNPATSAAWTQSDAQAATLEWGVEAVA